MATSRSTKMGQFLDVIFVKSTLWRHRVDGSGRDKLNRLAECSDYC